MLKVCTKYSRNYCFLSISVLVDIFTLIRFCLTSIPTPKSIVYHLRWLQLVLLILKSCLKITIQKHLKLLTFCEFFDFFYKCIKYINIPIEVLKVHNINNWKIFFSRHLFPSGILNIGSTKSVWSFIFLTLKEATLASVYWMVLLSFSGKDYYFSQNY